MNISFLIPTKDGGEDYLPLYSSILISVNYAKKKGITFNYSINFLINGNPHNPLYYIKQINQKNKKAETILCPSPGKIKALKLGLKKIESDIYIFLDDDVRFSKENLYLALSELLNNKKLKLVSFQPKTLDYPNKDFIGKLKYDIINVRQLKNLYKGVDPFLFGRFMVMRKNVFNVPSNILLEDLYLSNAINGEYIIRPEFVFYFGLSSISKHVKRVIMLETGREQVKKLFPNTYSSISQKNQRVIDENKVKSLSLYYKCCFISYNILRFFTNKIISKFFKHKNIYW